MDVCWHFHRSCTTCVLGLLLCFFLFLFRLFLCFLGFFEEEEEWSLQGMIIQEPWINPIQPLDLESPAHILLPWFISEIQEVISEIQEVFNIINRSVEHTYCYSIQTPLGPGCQFKKQPIFPPHQVQESKVSCPHAILDGIPYCF